LLPRLSDRLFLLAAAVLFSTGGAAIKAIHLTPWQIASLRSGIAAAALLILLRPARKGWGVRLIPASLAYAATLVAFVVATKLTTAANAIFLQSAAPLYLLVIGPLLLRERIRRVDLAFAGALVTGMAMMLMGTEAPTATTPDPGTGNLIAALSGIAWAFTIAALRWVGRHSESGDAISAVAAGNAVACLVALPAALPLQSLHAADLAALFYLGIVQIGLAYVFLTRGLRRVSAFEASALLLLEPVLNPVWAWLLHNEVPSARAAAGGGVILAAVFMKAWMSRQQDPFVVKLKGA
jgi:drug/metabolite transporter (DMT)-like permease